MPFLLKCECFSMCCDLQIFTFAYLQSSSVIILAAISHPNEKTDFLSFWPCLRLVRSQCLDQGLNLGHGSEVLSPNH